MSILSKSPSLPDSQVLLRGIRWETYEQLLADLDGSTLRLTYDDGCFPWLPVEPFAAHVPAIYESDETTWIRGFRAWVVSQRKGWGV